MIYAVCANSDAGQPGKRQRFVGQNRPATRPGRATPPVHERDESLARVEGGTHQLAVQAVVSRYSIVA